VCGTDWTRMLKAQGLLAGGGGGMGNRLVKRDTRDQITVTCVS